MELPHYFVASRRSPGLATRPTAPLAHAVDCFVLEAPHASHVEVAVGVTADGSLDFAVGAEVRPRLAATALNALHYHEITPPPRRRVVRAESLYVFDLQLVEQVASSPELNDPVYLYGTLIGPVLGPAAPRAIQGQITMTRGDLLHGFFTARPWAFRYPARTGASPCCFHAVLPAEREDELASGRGVVLAYPLLPSELADEHMDNASVVRLILADAIRALRVDLERNHRERSWLARSFGRNESKQLALSEDAKLDECFEVAERALAMLRDWPSERAAELGRRVSAHVAGTMEPTRAPARPHRPSAAPASVQHVAPPAPVPPRHGPPTIKAALQAGEPPEWMRDFMSDHAPGGHHVSWSTRQKPHTDAARPPARGPEWMGDFEAPRAPSPEDASKSERPEWMNDFEDE